ncbi:hypothetical protein L6452_37512 [Arctium lappa]|uniref:Uncharacterized protein n=1 Tax=Arctium lappa TaxID=4217 RepID=A0ACB8Y360_ARCLA|nr:hypothetical protein L6452_37512 [Arctium lappa]
MKKLKYTTRVINDARKKRLYVMGPGDECLMLFPHILLSIAIIEALPTTTKDYSPAGPQPPFRGRHNFGRGGRWDKFRGPHQPSGQGTVPALFDLDRPRHGAIMDRDHPMSMRGQSFLPEEKFTMPYGGRHYEDPYIYGDTARGVKRPYFAIKFTDKEVN